MAGKGDGKNRKRSKKSKLDIERVAYDILSFTLPICGFPKEKIKYREGKQNVYRYKQYVQMIGSIAMSFALNHRDEWKTMFESRFKNSGFDTNEKYEKYLTSFFVVFRKFQEANTPEKVLYTLAVYSEFILYLNHKGIQFDLDLLLHSWSRYFTQYIAQCNTDELLHNLFTVHSDPSQYIDWIVAFIRDVATPYGSKDDISTLFRLRSDKAFRRRDKKDKQMVDILKLLADQASSAEESKLMMPAGFDSPAVLPGDRDSPEPLSSHEKGAGRGKKKYGKELTSSTSDSDFKSGGRQRSKTSSELDMNDRFQQMGLRSGKISKKDPDEMSEKGKSRKRVSC